MFFFPFFQSSIRNDAKVIKKIMNNKIILTFNIFKYLSTQGNILEKKQKQFPSCTMCWIKI